jgi:hypothetical protein
MSRLPDNDYIPECRKTVVVDAQTTRTAETKIVFCETCSPDMAEVPFDCVLDSITGCNPRSTDYVLSETAHCPACGAKLLAGSWRWIKSEKGLTAFILPSTLVIVNNEISLETSVPSGFPVVLKRLIPTITSSN